MRKEITSTYGFIEIPASATRYLDLPESVKAELYTKKKSEDVAGNLRKHRRNVARWR